MPMHNFYKAVFNISEHRIISCCEQEKYISKLIKQRPVESISKIVTPNRN